MKVKNRQLLQESIRLDGTTGGPRVITGQSMDTAQEQKMLSPRQLLKKELEAMYDPIKDMTEEDHAAYKQKLMAKVQSGKKLTAQEMNYLRIHDPAAYRLARRLEYKRMKLEQRLKACQSKEEAEEVYNQSIGGISKEDPDREAIMNTYKETYEEFKKTMQYARLPETKREAEAKNLYGKRKKAFLEGSDEHEMEIDLLFETMTETTVQTQDGLVKLEEEATPWDELLDDLPVMDVVG